MSTGPHYPASSPRTDSERDELQPILEALRGLKYGSITVIVQDGVIVQIDRIEKRRIPRRNAHDDAK